MKTAQGTCHVAYEKGLPNPFHSLCWHTLVKHFSLPDLLANLSPISHQTLFMRILTGVAFWNPSVTDPELLCETGVVGSWCRLMCSAGTLATPCACELFSFCQFPLKVPKCPHKPHAQSTPFRFVGLQIPVCPVPEAASESNQSHCSAISD